MNITYVYSSCPSDQRFIRSRCKDIGEAIERTGWHTVRYLLLDDFVANSEAAQEACQDADLLVIHRYLYGPVLSAVQYWKARDKKVIIDFDEAFDLLAPDQPGFHFWNEEENADFRAGGTQNIHAADFSPLEQFRWGLKMVDAATVASARLADDWSNHVRTILLPDYLNLDRYLTLRQDHPNEIWIGLDGTGLSAESLWSSGVLPALEQVALENPKVRVWLAGLDVPTRIPKKQLLEVPLQTIDHWHSLLASLDIGLAPVTDPYGLRLGRWRVLEYMALKIPWIGSDSLPYRELSRYGWLIPNTIESWRYALVEMLSHIDVYRDEAVREPFLYALSQDVHENVSKVLEIYHTILSKPRA